MRVVLEFITNVVRRDALLATLMDGVRSSGNKDVHIKMNPTNRGHRLGMNIKINLMFGAY